MGDACLGDTGSPLICAQESSKNKHSYKFEKFQIIILSIDFFFDDRKNGSPVLHGFVSDPVRVLKILFIYVFVIIIYKIF